MTADCAVVGCPNDTSKGGKGLCGMHRARVRRAGSPGPVGTARAAGRTTSERIYPRLVLNDKGCWVWQGATTKDGYGVIGVGPRITYVHRWVYVDLVGDIPDGLVLDHLCLNPPCANPDHLDPVTRAVNNARGGHTTGARAS